jgi:hypothetical protein
MNIFFGDDMLISAGDIVILFPMLFHLTYNGSYEPTGVTNIGTK